MFALLVRLKLWIYHIRFSKQNCESQNIEKGLKIRNLLRFWGDY